MTTNDKKEEIEVSAQEELNYKKSGVDVEAGYELVQKIKPFVEKTKRPEILSGLGSFSALSRIPKHIENPILVTCENPFNSYVFLKKNKFYPFLNAYLTYVKFANLLFPLEIKLSISDYCIKNMCGAAMV